MNVDSGKRNARRTKNGNQVYQSGRLLQFEFSDLSSSSSESDTCERINYLRGMEIQRECVSQFLPYFPCFINKLRTLQFHP